MSSGFAWCSALVCGIKVLKAIRILISSDAASEGTAWIQELCRGLVRNRSLEKFALNLKFAEHVDIFQSITPFFKHNNNLRHVEIYNPTPRALQSLSMVLLSKCKMIESVTVHDVRNSDEGAVEFFASMNHMHSLLKLIFRCNYLGIEGCAALATLLGDPASKLQVLDLGKTEFLNDDCIAILGEALIGHIYLRTLSLDRIDLLGDSDWRTIASILSHPMCLLEKMDLSCTFIDDDGATQLGNALAMNNTLKQLFISNNPHITSTGWEGFSICLRTPMSALEFLIAQQSEIDDDGFMSMFTALVGNSSLKGLNVRYNGKIIDSEVSTYLSCVLCDKTSIERTYSSNHTLQSLRGYYSCADFRIDIIGYFSSLLEMNKYDDKVEVARQKILKYHFSGGSGDLHVFDTMSETLMPHAIAWIGRNRIGSTLMFNFVRGFPVLFNISHESTSEMKKRKR
jgi:hypothetical protein